jgi:class 3 adenylate cyclase
LNPQFETGRYSGTILLADISGYTSFLDDVRTAHQDDAFADGQIPDAYSLMSSLLDGIASNIDPPLTLVKFEGDAVFAVAPEDRSPHGEAIVECAQTCYRDFRTRLAEAGMVWTCTCDACGRKDSLDLKFVIHYGDYFVQAVGTHVEVLGPDVNVAHRLLKNSAASHIGTAAYALFTDGVIDALEVPLADAVSFTEPINGMQPIGVRVVPLHD